MSNMTNSFQFGASSNESVPVHGGTELTDEQMHAVSEQMRDIADVPAVEIIGAAAVHLMSAAAVKCGLAAEDNAAAAPEIGSQHAAPLRDGLRTLQLAFREASSIPDEPGQGPGEKFTGPVY